MKFGTELHMEVHNFHNFHNFHKSMEVRRKSMEVHGVDLPFNVLNDSIFANIPNCFKMASNSHNPLLYFSLNHEKSWNENEIWQRPSYYCPKRVLVCQNLQLLRGPRYVQNGCHFWIILFYS